MVRLYAERGVEEGLPKARMPKILWRADCLLRRDEFRRPPFRGELDARRGRPTIPLEVFLRLMFLRWYYEWGYERLVLEVDTTPHLQRFCRLGVDDRVPHSTTLSKLAVRIGHARIQGLLDDAATRLGLLDRSDASCSV